MLCCRATTTAVCNTSGFVGQHVHVCMLWFLLLTPMSLQGTVSRGQWEDLQHALWIPLSKTSESVMLYIVVSLVNITSVLCRGQCEEPKHAKRGNLFYIAGSFG